MVAVVDHNTKWSDLTAGREPADMSLRIGVTCKLLLAGSWLHQLPVTPGTTSSSGTSYSWVLHSLTPPQPSHTIPNTFPLI